jgi:hypothetical protein
MFRTDMLSKRAGACGRAHGCGAWGAVQRRASKQGRARSILPRHRTIPNRWMFGHPYQHSPHDHFDILSSVT